MEKKKWWLQKRVVPIILQEDQLVIDLSKGQVEIKDPKPHFIRF